MITVYRRHWLLLISAAMVILIPQAVADAFLDGLNVEGINSARDAALVAALPLTIAVNLLGQAIYAGFAASAVVEWRAGRPVPGVIELARALPLGRLIVIDLITTFGAAIGLSLLFVPGLVFLAYFGIAPALIKIEHRTVLGSLRRCVELVRGHLIETCIVPAGVIIAVEALAQILVAPFHGLASVTAVDLIIQGFTEPIEGLTIVVVALNLLELRGEAPPVEELTIGRAAG